MMAAATLSGPLVLLQRLVHALAAGAVLLLLLGRVPGGSAAPGLCVGPVCADQISRGSQHPFQLRLRLSDQRGHRERISIDCRNGSVSPLIGPVDRGYGSALARRACRLVGETPA